MRKVKLYKEKMGIFRIYIKVRSSGEVGFLKIKIVLSLLNYLKLKIYFYLFI